MGEGAHPDFPVDSLDLVECVMAIEEAFSHRHLTPGQHEQLMRKVEGFLIPHLPADERDRLISELYTRIANGELDGDDDFDDGALTALVRKLGPRSPRGQAGAAARPDEPL